MFGQVIYDLHVSYRFFTSVKLGEISQLFPLVKDLPQDALRAFCA